MVKKIAITGGIGSGKSLVLECIKELGYPVFSCDMIYKELLQTPKFARKIAELFPSCVKNNEIDRKELGNIVFNNKENIKTQAFKYFLLAIVILILNTCILKLLVDYLFVNKFVSKLLVEFMLMFLSFIVQKKFVFGKKN